jgi:L-ribulose-5-phosphate 3-epimerase
MDRRDFVKKSSILGAGLAASPSLLSSCSSEPWFQISLAQWSLHRAMKSGEIKHLSFPAKVKRDYGITAVEYVSSFFGGLEIDPKFNAELKKTTDYNGITNVLIMIDGEGALGDADKTKRKKAVENHQKWVEIAKFLGCHSIRVDARGPGNPEELSKTAAVGLRQLSKFASPFDIGVIVENHGGPSSNGAWLAKLIKSVDLPNCGTLPDFGNFNIGNGEEYDRYLGTKELMPYAKGVSAKTYDFDADGNETTIDFDRMMQIVKKAKYRGYIGIEYEGNNLSEEDGIRATKRLLERYM